MNRLELTGELVQVDPVRYSPAGVPIAEAVIRHRSSLTADGRERQVEYDLTMQASGPFAARLASLPPGTQVAVEGALNRRSVKSRQLILIVNRIEKE